MFALNGRHFENLSETIDQLDLDFSFIISAFETK